LRGENKRRDAQLVAPSAASLGDDSYDLPADEAANGCATKEC